MNITQDLVVTAGRSVQVSAPFLLLGSLGPQAAELFLGMMPFVLVGVSFALPTQW